MKFENTTFIISSLIKVCTTISLVDSSVKRGNTTRQYYPKCRCLISAILNLYLFIFHRCTKIFDRQTDLDISFWRKNSIDKEISLKVEAQLQSSNGSHVTQTNVLFFDPVPNLPLNRYNRDP